MTTITKPSVKSGERNYQAYKSARMALRIIAPTGHSVIFTKHTHYTQIPAVIEYLDEQIKCGGLPGITKGESLTAEERDPMAMLRRQIIEEHEEAKAKAASDAVKGISADMGATAGAKVIGAATTKDAAK